MDFDKDKVIEIFENEKFEKIESNYSKRQLEQMFIAYHDGEKPISYYKRTKKTLIFGIYNSMSFVKRNKALLDEMKNSD